MVKTELLYDSVEKRRSGTTKRKAKGMLLIEVTVRLNIDLE